MTDYRSSRLTRRARRINAVKRRRKVARYGKKRAMDKFPNLFNEDLFGYWPNK